MHSLRCHRMCLGRNSCGQVCPSADALNVNIHEAVSTHLYDTASRQVQTDATLPTSAVPFVARRRTMDDCHPLGLYPESLHPPTRRSSLHSPRSWAPDQQTRDGSNVYTDSSLCNLAVHNASGPHVPRCASDPVTLSKALDAPASAPELPMQACCLGKLRMYAQKPQQSYTAVVLHIPDSDLRSTMHMHMTPIETIAPCAGLTPSFYSTASTAMANSTAELSMSIAMHPPASTSVNRRAGGQPTASHELEPGPFHRTNAALRRQLQHYTVEVRTIVSWDQLSVRICGLLCFFLYAGVRAFYLVSGRSATIDQQDVSIAYSWAMLVAEVFLFLVALYDGHLFWQQTLVYTPMEKEDVEDMATVRRHTHRNLH